MLTILHDGHRDMQTVHWGHRPSRTFEMMGRGRKREKRNYYNMVPTCLVRELMDEGAGRR